MDQTRARRALEAVLITGLCGSQAGVPETKRAAHLQSGPLNACPICSWTCKRRTARAEAVSCADPRQNTQQIVPPPVAGLS